jgi:hypothetical protein
MYRKELDDLVDEVMAGQTTAEEVLFKNHLDHLEAVYFMKHLLSECIDKNPDLIESRL